MSRHPHPLGALRATSAFLAGVAANVVAALGLIPECASVLHGEDFRRYITPWERIEEDR